MNKYSQNIINLSQYVLLATNEHSIIRRYCVPYHFSLSIWYFHLSVVVERKRKDNKSLNIFLRLPFEVETSLGRIMTNERFPPTTTNPILRLKRDHLEKNQLIFYRMRPPWRLRKSGFPFFIGATRHCSQYLVSGCCDEFIVTLFSCLLNGRL